MATSVKNAIARALVEGVIIDLMLKTNTDNVVLDDNGTEVTLSAKLAEYIAALNGKATPEDITNALNSYVKKDGSKVLSTNDFTTDLLNKLNGIAEGAQVNKIETIKVNGTAQTIASDKSVNITVPTKVSQLTNDSSRWTRRWQQAWRTASTPASRKPAVCRPWRMPKRTSCIWCGTARPDIMTFTPKWKTAAEISKWSSWTTPRWTFPAMSRKFTARDFPPTTLPLLTRRSWTALQRGPTSTPTRATRHRVPAFGKSPWMQRAM